jgi:uncharacterized protein YggT (Ycf19 family)
MGAIDLMLNLAALLLWFNWRSLAMDPLALSPPTTLIGTLRRAEPRRTSRWPLLAGIVGLLFVRAVLYWQVGPAANWTPSLKLGAITLSFRHDFFARALTFSGLSFVFTLVVFYGWLLLLSLVNCKVPDSEPLQKLTRLHLGWLERWPWVFRLLGPLLFTSLLWLALASLFVRWQVIPRPTSSLHRLEQAGAIGLGVYLSWKYLIVTMLVIYLINSYVYLGSHPLWNFITVTGRNLLTPLRFLPLRLGKVDFSPILAITLVVVLWQLAGRGLTNLYERLPL